MRIACCGKRGVTNTTEASVNDNDPSASKSYCHVCMLLGGQRVHQVWRNERILNDAYGFFNNVAEYFKDQPRARLLACVLFNITRLPDGSGYGAEVAGKPLTM